MTKEEAGQRILEGNHMVPCKRCDRVGARGSDIRERFDLPPWRLCKDCGYDGLVLEQSYEEACRVLEMPLPKNPMALPQSVLDDMRREEQSLASERPSESVLPSESR